MEQLSLAAIEQRLVDFWALVVDVWRNGVWGFDIAEIVIALGIFCVFLVFRGLFARFALRAAKRASARSSTHVDDELVEAMGGPLRFIPIVMGVFFASSVVSVDDEAREVIYNVNRTLVAFTLFWALYALAGPVRRVLRSVPGILTEAMIDWIVKAARVLFVALGAATILEMWNIAVAPIIAGLGLFGVAVALGAQGLFRNLIAGLFVIGEQRFNPGDWIRVDGIVEGTVESIGFRTTTVRQFDKAPVYVPNDVLADNSVINFSRMTHRRIMWVIGLEYRTTLEQLRQIRDQIEDYVFSSTEFAHSPEVTTFVRVDAFSDSSIDILLYAFTHTTQWTEWLEIKERLAYRVKDIVEGAGAAFAFPSRSLYVEAADVPEVFPLQTQSEGDARPEPATAATATASRAS